MASIKVHLSKYRSTKNGTYPLVFQLIHRRKKKVIYSPYKLFKECFDEKKGRVVNRQSVKTPHSQEINEYLADMQYEFRQVIELLSEQEEEFSVDDIVALFKSNQDNSFVSTYMQKVISSMKKQGQYASASSYECTLNRIQKFTGDKYCLCFEDITVKWLNRFITHLQHEGLKTNTVHFYIRILRAVYNKAFKEGIPGAQGASPFRKITLGHVRTAKRAIDKSSIIQIAKMELEQESRIEMARDFFLFSYYTRGMAFVDMAFLKYSDITDGVISYARRKTGQPLQVRIVEPLQALIDKYRNAGEYVLPILSSGSKSLYNEYRSGLKRYNAHLKNLSEKLQFSQPLTSYVARHSWATIAKRCGASVSVISEGLGHSSEKVTYTYLAALDPSVIDAVNDSVSNLHLC